MEPSPAQEDRTRALAILRAHGADATSFQLLGPGYRHFFAEGGFVAYVDTGGAWVAGGGPVAPRDARPALAAAFVRAAAALGRRASFFAVDAAFCELAGLPHVRVGEQPWWDPAQWAKVLASHASLRYQIKRALAKHVVVRRVPAREMSDERGPIRRAVEQLARAWLGTRPLAPMGFLVEVAPFDFPEERVYLVAEVEGRVVGFLAAAPVYARRGWLVENLLRTHDAPNGAAELLVDRMMRIAATDPGSVVTLGLAPLAGRIPRRLELARALASPLYDFRGLRAFKAKLRPDGWESIAVAAAPGASPWIALADGLQAFARGSLVRFGVTTLARGPIAVLWTLTMLLTLWTPLLALAPTRRFFPSPFIHHAWVTFDVALVVALLALCRQHRTWLAVAVAATVSLDALVTTTEVLAFNAPRLTGAADLCALTAACAGPTLAAIALWGAVRRHASVQP